jgi:hypothetical protein
MQNIRSIDMLFLDELFKMSDGYVLNFSDRTMAVFFAEKLNIDIDDSTYSRNGSSKAKRLRCFLQTVDKPTAIRTLNALWEYRRTLQEQFQQPEILTNAHGRFLALINRLRSENDSPPFGGIKPNQALDRAQISYLRSELCSIYQLAPQQRGFAFERFLKQLFDLYKLEARDAFRLRGEQIDGSFQFHNDTYLLESKWQRLPCGVAELHVFHGKIEQKAAWTRGLFISYEGFSEDGLVAFGRGKRIICMDGADLFETLDREIPLNYVLASKIRSAAETGNLFARVRDLLPR